MECGVSSVVSAGPPWRPEETREGEFVQLWCRTYLCSNTAGRGTPSQGLEGSRSVAYRRASRSRLAGARGGRARGLIVKGPLENTLNSASLTEYVLRSTSVSTAGPAHLSCTSVVWCLWIVLATQP